MKLYGAKDNEASCAFFLMHCKRREYSPKQLYYLMKNSPSSLERDLMVHMDKKGSGYILDG